MRINMTTSVAKGTSKAVSEALKSRGQTVEAVFDVSPFISTVAPRCDTQPNRINVSRLDDMIEGCCSGCFGGGFVTPDELENDLNAKLGCDFEKTVFRSTHFPISEQHWIAVVRAMVRRLNWKEFHAVVAKLNKAAQAYLGHAADDLALEEPFASAFYPFTGQSPQDDFGPQIDNFEPGGES